MFRSGYVAIVGSPNAGKSTLLNEILDAKIAITSDKVGTTRNMIKGIKTTEDYQIVFVDTPGINTPQNKLQVYMKNQAQEAILNVDIIIYMLDAPKGIRKKEEEIIREIKKNKHAVKIACLNKMDLISQEKALELIQTLNAKELFEETFVISAKNGLNVDNYLKDIVKYLPEGNLIYSPEEQVDFTTKFYIKEIIREKVLRNTHNELPHSVYVEVKTIEEEQDKLYIEAIIYVARESQKPIVIGSKGSMIKTIGKNARYDLESFFGQKVYLDLVVRVDKKWTDKAIEIFDTE